MRKRRTKQKPWRTSPPSSGWRGTFQCNWRNGDVTHHWKKAAHTVPTLPKPSELNGFDFWWYGQGSHSSQRKRIIDSIILRCCSDCEMPTMLRHLLISGSSLRVVGRNVMYKWDLLHHGQEKNNFSPPARFQKFYVSFGAWLLRLYSP